MLVLNRKVGERIVIGDEIVVTVVSVHGQQVRVGIQDEGTIDARYGLENRRRKIEHALVAKQIMKLILRSVARRRLPAWSRGQQIGVGNQAAGCARVIEHNKKAAAAIFHEVQGRNEQHFCQFGITQTLLPKTIFFDGVCDPPAPIQKSKYLHSVCKYLHLSSRREDEADMTAA